MFFKSGFSLIELIAVILIVGVLAFTVYPRFVVFNFSLIDSKNKVVDAVRHARELSLYRAETNASILLITTATTIDVRNNGVSVSYPGVDYPLVLPASVSLSGDLGISIFDTFGQTNPILINVSDGTHVDSMRVTGAGYVY